jgi:hypothetical protein
VARIQCFQGAIAITTTAIGLRFQGAIAITTTAIGLLTSFGWFTPMQAHPPRFTVAQSFEPPPGQGAPAQTTGGGRRDGGQCPNLQTRAHSSAPKVSLNQLLVPLIPPTNRGLTTAERPTFFFYVPATSAKTADFVLEDNKANRVVAMQMKLSGAAGVVSLTPPRTAPALQNGQTYRWIFSLVCSDEGDLRDPIVTGKVQRIQPAADLNSRLTKASPFEQVKLYAASGIWYEAVTQLAALRKAQPNDPKLAQAWRTLLGSVGLETIAPAPLKP